MQYFVLWRCRTSVCLAISKSLIINKFPEHYISYPYFSTTEIRRGGTEIFSSILFVCFILFFSLFLGTLKWKKWASAQLYIAAGKNDECVTPRKWKIIDFRSCALTSPMYPFPASHLHSKWTSVKNEAAMRGALERKTIMHILLKIHAKAQNPTVRNLRTKKEIKLQIFTINLGHWECHWSDGHEEVKSNMPLWVMMLGPKPENLKLTLWIYMVEGWAKPC